MNGLLAADPLVLLARALLALAALGIVPLGLSAAAPRGEPLTPFYTRLRWVAGAAGPLVVATLVLPAGRLAGALSVAWVGVGALSATYGLRRIVSRPGRARFDLPSLAIDAGLAYLLVGAAWTWIYRADATFAGFSGTQALLTANHFHYAGFGLCVMVGALGRVVDPSRITYRAAAALAVLAVALVALGITFSHALEVAAAWTLVLGVLCTAENLVRAGRSARGAARALFFVSATSGVVAGLFAAHFATSGFAKLDAGALRRMLLLHGAVNAMGFVGAALLALRVSTAGERASRESPTPDAAR